jgi:hypothetical protein
VCDFRKVNINEGVFRMAENFVLKRIDKRSDCIYVEYICNKKTYGRKIFNPIHLLTDENLPIHVQADIINMFNDMNIIIDHEKEVIYTDEKELNEAIQKLESMIDKYTMYIENYNQMKEAERDNAKIENIIKYIKENKRLPKRLTKKGYKMMLEQLNAILLGLQKRSDRIIVLHMIAWLKKLGFFKAYHTENTIYYMFTMPTTYLTMRSDFYCKIEKKGNNYNVDFYYKNVNVKNNKNYMLWEKESAFNKMEAGYRWYNYPLF